MGGGFKFFVFICLFSSHISFAKLDIHKPYPSGLWRRDYTAFVKHQMKEEAHQPLMDLPKSMLQELCPRYDRLKRSDKENFWVTFFMSLAYAESGFDNHSGPKSGIMQLTCDSNARKGYGCSLCTSNQKLRSSPLVGIDCAMKIVKHWAKKGVLIGRHPYFATLRKNNHYLRKIKPTIQVYAPKECKNQFTPTPWHWVLKQEKIENLWPYRNNHLE